MDRIGRYEVVGRIGSGGFATVYRVRDPVLDSEVAAKVLADNWCYDAEIRDRFIREAQLLRRIDSDRVVTVHDIGELPSGQPYFVMALADRGTLEDRLVKGSTPSVPDVQAIADRLAECIGTVHHHDLIHRDIKPSNLLIAASRSSSVGAAPSGLLDQRERLVLGDFGLAKDIALQVSGLTIAAGTGGYAAPEQMTPDGSPDRRTDLYAATGVMYRVISGTTPPPYDLATRTVPLGKQEWWMAGAMGAFFSRGMAFDQTHRHPSIDSWHAELSSAMAPFAGAGPVGSRTAVAAPSAPGSHQGGPSVPGPSSDPRPAAPSYQQPSGPPPAPGGYSRPDHSRPDHSQPVSHLQTSYVEPPPAGFYQPPANAQPPAPVAPQPSPFHRAADRRPSAPPFQAGRGPSDRRAPSRRWFPLVLVALLLAGAGGLYYLFARPGSEIEGPDQVVAGEQGVYTAAFDGAQRFVWTDWNGETKQGDQFTVRGLVPGALTFGVVGYSAGGEEVGSAERTATITPSPDAPTIVGDDQIPVLGQATYTIQSAAGYEASNPQWIDAATGQWVAGSTYTLTAAEVGSFTITLQVTLSDGRNVGTTKVVQFVAG